MAHNEQTSTADLTSLMEGIFNDARKLIEQQFELLRKEMKDEVGKVKRAAASMALGAGLTATGGILSTLMLVHLLHKATKLPLWSCYGIVGGALAAAGAKCLTAGVAEVAEVRLLPRQTTEALKENVSAIADNVTALAH